MCRRDIITSILLRIIINHNVCWNQVLISICITFLYMHINGGETFVIVYELVGKSSIIKYVIKNIFVKRKFIDLLKRFISSQMAT